MFTIYFWDTTKGWNEIATVSGCEAAMEIFKNACNIAQLTGMTCALVDAETGEVLAECTNDPDREVGEDEFEIGLEDLNNLEIEYDTYSWYNIIDDEVDWEW